MKSKKSKKGISKIGKIVLNCALWGIIGTGAIMMGKNIAELDPASNLEMKITKSDIKQMNHLNELVDEKDFSSEWLNGQSGVLLNSAFHSYALTNMAISEPKLKDTAADYIQKNIETLLSDKVYDEMLVLAGKKGDEKPFVDNAMYLGHLNLMLGCYKLISDSTEYDNLAKDLTQYIHKKVSDSKNLNIQTFQKTIYPADNTVALASLDLYDKLNGTQFSKVNEKWKKYMQENLTDENGLMYSEITPSGTIREARGCSSAYGIIFRWTETCFEPV